MTDKGIKKVNDGKPKSMVIRIGAGEVGASVSQLVKDVRQVMEPDTAVRLKVCLRIHVSMRMRSAYRT